MEKDLIETDSFVLCSPRRITYIKSKSKKECRALDDERALTN